MARKRLDFYPATPQPSIIRLANAILPSALRWCGVATVSLPPDDLARLQSHSSGRCIIAPNHPSRVEPLIVGYLASRINRSFYYVSARENFELSWGPFMQRIGAYSIARGTPDRTSISTTRALLAEQDRQVVLFPEGEVYHHNDIMLPLNSGVVQIGFWALQDLQKAGRDLSLPIIPIAVKYRFLDPPRQPMLNRVARLEQAVGITSPSENLKERVIALGMSIVATLEAQYRVPHEGALPKRIERIKDRIIDRGVALLGLEPRASDATHPEKMRQLFNAVREFKCELEKPKTQYEERLLEQRAVQINLALADLGRIHDCIAISGHYVSDHPTFERLSDVIGRMEEEVFGKHVRYPRREALIRIAEPLDLGTLVDDYKSNKRETTAKATAEVALRIANILESLADSGTAISEADWPRTD